MVHHIVKNANDAPVYIACESTDERNRIAQNLKDRGYESSNDPKNRTALSVNAASDKERDTIISDVQHYHGPSAIYDSERDVPARGVGGIV